MYGNFHIFPRPTELPMAARIKPADENWSFFPDAAGFFGGVVIEVPPVYF
jgi:hypothetical protein